MNVVDPTGYASLGGELSLSNLGQLELLRATMERGLPLRTRVLGLSMMPLIRDEDVVTIVPLDDVAPSVGDVVAFVVPGTGRLALHRVVARAGDGWVLRGDNCRESDGAVAANGILGKIVRVERKGADVSFGTGVRGAGLAWLSRCGVLAAAKAALAAPRHVASQALRYGQGFAVYRGIGRLVALRLEITEAAEDELWATRRDLVRSGVRPRWSETTDQVVTNWVATRRGRIVGFVQLVRRASQEQQWNGYWLFSLMVRVPYRRLGIGELLTLRVIERARFLGGDALHLLVFDDSGEAIVLYRKLGFEQVADEGLLSEAEVETRPGSRRQIVMRKILI